jgi:hypothetical protein
MGIPEPADISKKVMVFAQLPSEKSMVGRAGLYENEARRTKKKQFADFIIVQGMLILILTNWNHSATNGKFCGGVASHDTCCEWLG